MKADADMTDDGIFTDVSSTIRKALKEVQDVNQKTSGVSTTALNLALKKLI